jgi:NADH:ubiquinone reductase (H+-translocating)
MDARRRHVVIVGGGFAGLNAARILGGASELDVSVIDRRNHHVFQPLLYQVAMAGLSPAEIAAPIRALLSRHPNVRVIQGEVTAIDMSARKLAGDFGELGYDFLILATGAQHAYFGHERWERFAPGLKTLEQATEIRRRVLTAFELAEREPDPERRKQQLTFVIVGGGPTGVELAGAIGEMSRFTLARDFRNIDPKLTRVILVEAGPRILPSFAPELASRATRDLEMLGVQLWTHSLVTDIDADGVRIGDERIRTGTVLWAAGVRASGLGAALGVPCDPQGRVLVTDALTVPDHPEVFVLGDLAHAKGADGRPLPGVAPVALQQGRYAARAILAQLAGKPRAPFAYLDKGQMATIGRSRAIVQVGSMKITGWFAWLTWLLIHIYYLSGFKNRLFVLLQWAWSYVTFARGARLIVQKTWRSYPEPERAAQERSTAEESTSAASAPQPPA